MSAPCEGQRHTAWRKEREKDQKNFIFRYATRVVGSTYMNPRSGPFDSSRLLNLSQANSPRSNVALRKMCVGCPMSLEQQSTIDGKRIQSADISSNFQRFFTDIVNQPRCQVFFFGVAVGSSLRSSVSHYARCRLSLP